ncbi:MAG: bifunctional nuclease family protein [Halobacteriaceae archaeon]
MNAQIGAVRVAGTPDGPVPVVVLEVEGEDDVVPIFVGFDQAVSIARGQDAIDIGRPLTHDLLLDVIEELGGRVERVVVSELRDGNFIGDVHLATPRGEAVVDARPSDALGLAARTAGVVEVSDAVFEESREPRDRYADLQDVREVADVGG